MLIAGKRFFVGASLLVHLAFVFAAAGRLDAGGGLNPASPGLPPATAYGQAGIPNNNVSAMCVECHSAVPRTGRTTHFVPTGTRLTNNPAPGKERTAAWSGSGRSSEYGNFGTWTSDNAAAGEIICESCHNLLAHVTGGNNLLESSLPWDARPTQPNDLSSPTSTLCEGCHTAATLSPLAGVPGHHPMTGDTTSDGTLFSTTDTPFTRGYVDNVTEMGGAGSEVRYPAGNALTCLSCHGNGHAGSAGSGARILRKGYAGAATPTPPAPGSAVAGRDATGIDRQHDIDPAGTVRLITNSTPLCDACHKLDD